MSSNKLLSFVMLIAVVLIPRAQAAELAGVFGDHMVLQRDAKVPIWGTGNDDEQVTVTFAGQSVSTACADGIWRVELQPLSASARPQQLSITSNAGDKQLSDVLVGDVWIGSGQSNMAGRVSQYAKNDPKLAELAATPSFPMIRLLRSGSAWTLADQDNVANFSALCFAFGQRLQRELDVPVGLMVGAVGGTPSGYWIPPQRYAESAACKQVVAEFAKTYNLDLAQLQYEKQLKTWEHRVAQAKSAGKKPRGRKPTPPKGPGTSIRGGEVGHLYQKHIAPLVGYRICGVLWDQGEGRSGVVGVDQHTMMSELIRAWRDEWKQGEFPFLFVQKTSGGGCAFDYDNPITNQADPFIAKLPDIKSLVFDFGSREPLDRYMYTRLMLNNSNAWMVPAVDLGSGVHPTNKWGYGNRAAEVALSQVHQDGTQAYGPIYSGYEVDASELRLKFNQVGRGLTTAHSTTLQGFAVADDKGTWHWANARIEGKEVVVWSDEVPTPTRVSYAYANNRAWANLFNKDGLPALAFDHAL